MTEYRRHLPPKPRRKRIDNNRGVRREQCRIFNKDKWQKCLCDQRLISETNWWRKEKKERSRWNGAFVICVLQLIPPRWVRGAYVDSYENTPLPFTEFSGQRFTRLTVQWGKTAVLKYLNIWVLCISYSNFARHNCIENVLQSIINA